MGSCINSEIINGVRIVELCPRIDIHNVFEVEDEMISLANKEPTKIIIDFTKVEYFGSNGIRILILTRRILDQKGGRLLLASLNPFVIKILRAVDILDIFEVKSSRDSALAEFNNS